MNKSWAGSSRGDSTADEAAPCSDAPQWWDNGRTAVDGSKTLLVMEYADQHSLHTAISASRLKGNLVRFPILTFCGIMVVLYRTRLCRILTFDAAQAYGICQQRDGFRPTATLSPDCHLDGPSSVQSSRVHLRGMVTFHPSGRKACMEAFRKDVLQWPHIQMAVVVQEAILLCAMDIAAGMRYLHSMDVVHADLKPANVLLKSARRTPADPRGFTCKVQSSTVCRIA